MDKRGQLGWIEIKFWLFGLIVGLIVSLVLVYLGSSGVLPFEIPLVCVEAPAK